MRTVYFKNGLTKQISTDAALAIGEQASKSTVKFFRVMDNNNKFLFLLNMDEVLFIG